MPPRKPQGDAATYAKIRGKDFKCLAPNITPCTRGAARSPPHDILNDDIAFVLDLNGLDMAGLLAAFQEFWRENAADRDAPFEYRESFCQIVLQAFAFYEKSPEKAHQQVLGYIDRLGSSRDDKGLARIDRCVRTKGGR